LELIQKKKESKQKTGNKQKIFSLQNRLYGQKKTHKHKDKFEVEKINTKSVKILKLYSEKNSVKLSFVEIPSSSSSRLGSCHSCGCRWGGGCGGGEGMKNGGSVLRTNYTTPVCLPAAATACGPANAPLGLACQVCH
jgi:hypothetical protein